MQYMKIISFLLVLCLVVACGEDPPGTTVTSSAPPPDATNAAASAVDNTQAEQSPVSAGGVNVKILPENPTSAGCLRAVVHGSPGRGAIMWSVNGEPVTTRSSEAQLCSTQYKRGDLVTVMVGTADKGAQASVTIANNPPLVVDISSEPAEIFAGTDVTVKPVAEDVDGDDVGFYYQWLVNGIADPTLNQSVLPGDRFSKGDTIQVQIVPNDFYDDGPTYVSYAMSIPNAAPQINSQPPQGITSLDYQYQVVATDPDDNQLTYRLDEAPDGMTIDNTTGLINWSLREAQPGNHTIAIVVTDPEGAEAAQEYSLTLSSSQQ